MHRQAGLSPHMLSVWSSVRQPLPQQPPAGHARGCCFAFWSPLRWPRLLPLFYRHSAWVIIARFVAALPHGAYFGIASCVAASLMGPAKRGRGVAFGALRPDHCQRSRRACYNLGGPTLWLARCLSCGYMHLCARRFWPSGGLSRGSPATTAPVSAASSALSRACRSG